MLSNSVLVIAKEICAKTVTRIEIFPGNLFRKETRNHSSRPNVGVQVHAIEP